VGGGGVAAAGVFAVFGLMGDKQKSDNLDPCYPHCSAAAVSIGERDNRIADISLGVSIAAVGIAAGIAIVALATPPPSSRTGAGSAAAFTVTRDGLAFEF